MTPGAGRVHTKMMQRGGANSNWEHPFLLPQLLCGWDCRVLAVTPSWPTIKEVKWVLGGFGCWRRDCVLPHECGDLWGCSRSLLGLLTAPRSLQKEELWAVQSRPSCKAWFPQWRDAPNVSNPESTKTFCSSWLCEGVKVPGLLLGWAGWGCWVLSQSQQQLWVLLPLRYSFLIVQSALVSTGVGVKAGAQLLETRLLVALVGQRQQPLCFQGEHLFVLLHKSLGCVFCLAWSCGRGGVCGGPVTLSCVVHPDKESICHSHSLWAIMFMRASGKGFWSSSPFAFVNWSFVMKGRVSNALLSLVGQAGISVWYNGVLWVLGFLGGLQVENKADVTQLCLNFSFGNQ